MVINSKAYPWVLLVTLAFIWGSSFILIKRGLIGLSPQEVGALRIVSAGAFLAPIAIRGLRRQSRSNLVLLFFSGLLGSLIPAFLFPFAQMHLESSLTGVLNALTPTFVVIIGGFFFKSKISLETGAGIFLAFIGTAILISAASGAEYSFNAYAFLVVLATLMYASNLNLIKFKLANIKPLIITSISLFFVGLIDLIYLVFFTGFLDNINTATGLRSTIYIVILGVIGTAIALIIFNNLVKISNPVFTSSVTYLIPIVAIFWGVLDGEKLYLIHYIGIAFIILGVWLTNKKK